MPVSIKNVQRYVEQQPHLKPQVELILARAKVFSTKGKISGPNIRMLLGDDSDNFFTAVATDPEHVKILLETFGPHSL